MNARFCAHFDRQLWVGGGDLRFGEGLGAVDDDAVGV
jgi:hypothetical protein